MHSRLLFYLQEGMETWTFHFWFMELILLIYLINNELSSHLKLLRCSLRESFWCRVIQIKNLENVLSSLFLQVLILVQTLNWLYETQRQGPIRLKLSGKFKDRMAHENRLRIQEKSIGLSLQCSLKQYIRDIRVTS